MNILKQLFFLASLGIATGVTAQSTAESITITPTGQYSELTGYISGEQLWIDLNGNRTLDPGEAVQSGKKMVKALQNNHLPLTIYGKTITELILQNSETPDQIKAIDLTAAHSLTKLNLRGNPIVGELSLQSCPSIAEVNLRETMLEVINATACYSLTHLYASDSPKLHSLLLSDCNRLSWLEADRCALQNPILRGAISLSSIHLDDNELTELNIPMACTNLKVVSVSNNPNLKELSIRALATVTGLYASRCGLTAIDLSRGALLESVDLSCNELRELTLHVNPTRLKELRIYQNKFSLERMKQLVSTLPADDKSREEKRLIAINTQGITPREANVCSKSVVSLANSLGWDVYDYHGGVEQLYAGSSDPKIDPTKEGFIITTQQQRGGELSLDLKGSNLFIDLNGNNLCDPGESLQVGHNRITLSERNIVTIYGSDITEVRIPNGQLKGVDLAQAPHIESLDLSHNLLEFVDLSAQQQLKELDLSHNYLRSLLLPSRAPMNKLTLAFNQISSIELPAYHDLQELWLSNNSLTFFNPLALKSLQELHVEVNKIDLIAMRELVSQLPTKATSETKCKLYAVDTTAPDEANHISKSMVTTARSKGWSVYNGQTANYEGEPDQKLGEHAERIAITVSSEDPTLLSFFPKGEDCWVDLNGNDSYDPGEEIDASTGRKHQIRVVSKHTFTLYGRQITELRINDQAHVSKVDASEAHSIELLWVRDNDLSEIILPKGKTLKNLDLSNNKLSGDIDLRPYTALEKLFLVTNAYQSVAVSGLQQLKVLSLSENKLSTIDLTGCDNLQELYLASNQFASVDCSHLHKLETLSVFRNQIKRQAMQQLIDGLNDIAPSSKIRGKIFNVLYVTRDGQPSLEEHNELTPEQIKQAEQKQWTVNGWKEGGGVTVITALQECDAPSVDALTWYPIASGWVIAPQHLDGTVILSVFSLEGALIYRGLADQTLEIHTPLHKALLVYGDQRYLLIR